jgi:hypothetical protein
MEEIRHANKIFVRKFKEKRSFGRSMSEWENKIEIDIK